MRKKSQKEKNKIRTCMEFVHSVRIEFQYVWINFIHIWSQFIHLYNVHMFINADRVTLYTYELNIYTSILILYAMYSVHICLNLNFLLLILLSTLCNDSSSSFLLILGRNQFFLPLPLPAPPHSFWFLFFFFLVLLPSDEDLKLEEERRRIETGGVRRRENELRVKSSIPCSMLVMFLIVKYFILIVPIGNINSSVNLMIKYFNLSGPACNFLKSKNPSEWPEDWKQTLEMIRDIQPKKPWWITERLTLYMIRILIH